MSNNIFNNVYQNSLSKLFKNTVMSEKNYPENFEYLEGYPKVQYEGFKEPIRNIHEGLKNRPDFKERALNLAHKLKNDALHTGAHLTDIGCHFCMIADDLRKLGKEIIEAHKKEISL